MIPGTGSFAYGVKSFAGSYIPPLFRGPAQSPPHTIAFAPVHTKECLLREDGALIEVTPLQESVTGLYRAPVLSNQATSWLPAHATRGPAILDESGDVLMGLQLSLLGS